MILKWTFGLVFLTTLHIMESHGQARQNSTVYEDWYFNQYVNANNGNREFAHIAARWVSFMGIGGTAQRLNMTLTGGGRGRGGSQFQDQRGSTEHDTHAAHQVQARISIALYRTNLGFNEMKNRLGHTDVIPKELNQAFGTIIDNIQSNILDETLLNKIDFSKGYRHNKDAARDVQKKFTDGVDAALTGRNGEVENYAHYEDDKVLVRSLLKEANETYGREKLFNEGLKAGIINLYNQLVIQRGVETTPSTVPLEVDLPPDDVTEGNTYLASRRILGTRAVSQPRSG